MAVVLKRLLFLQRLFATSLQVLKSDFNEQLHAFSAQARFRSLRRQFVYRHICRCSDCQDSVIQSLFKSEIV